MVSVLKNQSFCKITIFIKAVLISIVVLFFIQNSFAEFSPSNYALYQFDRGTDSSNAIIVSPIQSAGVTHSLTVWRNDLADFAISKNDTSLWTLGPGWLLPESDSVAAKALRCTEKNRSYPVYYTNTSGSLSISRAPDPSLQTFCFSFKIAKIDTPVLLFSLALPKIRFFHTTSGNTSDSYYAAGLLTASGDLLIGRNNKTFTSDDKKVADSSKTDTIHYNFQTGQWYSAKIEVSKNSRGEDFCSFIIGDSILKTVQVSNIENNLKLVDGGAIIELAEYYGYSSTDTVGNTEIDLADFSYFEGMSGKDVYSKYGKWEPDPSPGSIDTLVYPAYVTQMLYDPPGNGSSASISSGQTITNTSRFNVGATAGATAFFGSEVASDVWTAGCGFDLQVTGGLKVSYDRSTENTTSYAVSTGFQSSVDASMTQYIGPGRGDMVAYLPLKLQRRLYRRPKINVLNPAADADYTYFLMTQILPDPDSKVRYTTISNLLETTKGDTSIFKYLQDESAIDLKTRRVRQELIGNRLKAMTNLDLSFAGGTPITQSSTLSSSSSVTHSLSGTLSLEMSTKLVVGTVKVGGSLSFEATVGGSETNASENTRTVSYTLSDNEGWDNYKITTYYDTRFGVYVFDVDSTQSNSSWPYEDGYSKKSVDWQIESADTVKSGVAGDMLDYAVTIKNASPNIGGVPNPLTLNAQVVNFPDQASVFPTELNISRNSNGTFTASLSSPRACTTSCILRISLPNPNGSGNPVIQDIPLVARFAPAATGIYAECKTDVDTVKAADAVTGNFQIVLKNIGSGSAQIETGITSASDGVTYQLGTFANPVAAGDSVTVSVSITGTGKKFPFTAKFWTKITGVTDSYKELPLTIVDSASVSIDRKSIVAVKTAGVLEVSLTGGKQLSVFAPGSTPATLRVFDLSGRTVFSKTNITGGRQYKIAAVNNKGFVLAILQQGSKKICRKIMIY